MWCVDCQLCPASCGIVLESRSAEQKGNSALFRSSMQPVNPEMNGRSWSHSMPGATHDFPGIGRRIRDIPGIAAIIVVCGLQQRRTFSTAKASTAATSSSRINWQYGQRHASGTPRAREIGQRRVMREFAPAETKKTKHPSTVPAVQSQNSRPARRSPPPAPFRDTRGPTR